MIQPSGQASTQAIRRLSRELAMRLMFQFQANGLRPEEIVFLFEQNFDPKNDEEACLDLTPRNFELAWPLAKDLFLGATRNLKELDQDIGQAASNWSLGRMSQVDLALLRLAYYEMRFRDDIPPRVSLNEAIEIAKSFGDHDSTSFINGVLDKLMAKGVVSPKADKPTQETNEA
ncbi:MAG: transcription antitermination factor NusB [Deltaproteobacteria bacterium]|jgi:N utilization substance protein B|nr:transcription antitermination factor NusB [Deltaproteobacteria bacterium]